MSRDRLLALRVFLVSILTTELAVTDGMTLLAVSFTCMGAMLCGWMVMGVRASAHANLIIENALLLVFGMANLAYNLPLTIPLGMTYAILTATPSILVILNSSLGTVAIMKKSMFLLVFRAQAFCTQLV